MALDTLQQAITECDLPALVHELFPSSGARPGRAGSIRAVWRGDKDPSGSLFQDDTEGTWLIKDWGNGFVGNAYKWLTEVVGWSKSETAQNLKSRAGLGTSAPARGARMARFQGEPKTAPSKPARVSAPLTQPPLDASWAETLRAAQNHLSEHPSAPLLARYGLSYEDATMLGLGLCGDGGLIIPLYALSEDGERFELDALKWRNPKDTKPRYRYLTEGRGTPPWLSLNLDIGTPRILIVEGEMNAIAAYLACRGHERIAVIGMPGAGSSLETVLHHLKGREVLLYADNDEPGIKALERWRGELEGVAGRVGTLTPLEEIEDFADALRLLGHGKLRHILSDRILDALSLAPDTLPTNPLARLGLSPIDATQISAPVEWIVDGIIPRAKITLVAAYGGVGKSSICADLAVCVETGANWLGHATFAVSGVLYIDYEDEASSFQRWVRRSLNGKNYPLDAAKPLYVSAQDHPEWAGRPFGEKVEELLVALEGQGHHLIILDAFETAMQIESIKAPEVLAAMSALKRLTHAGHTVVVLDHLPKVGKGQSKNDLMPSGSVQKTNQSRSVLVIEDVTPEGYEDGASILKIRCVKLNAAKRFDPFGIERRVNADSATFKSVRLPDTQTTPEGGRPAEASGALEPHIINQLRIKPSSFEELVELGTGMGTSKTTVYRLLNRLESEKRVMQKGGRGGLFHLLENGAERGPLE